MRTAKGGMRRPLAVGWQPEWEGNLKPTRRALRAQLKKRREGCTLSSPPAIVLGRVDGLRGGVRLGLGPSALGLFRSEGPKKVPYKEMPINILII